MKIEYFLLSGDDVLCLGSNVYSQVLHPFQIIRCLAFCDIKFDYLSYLKFYVKYYFFCRGLVY
jgi:hypothetical protein